jgi:hypothetical protein
MDVVVSQSNCDEYACESVLIIRLESPAGNWTGPIAFHERFNPSSAIALAARGYFRSAVSLSDLRPLEPTRSVQWLGRRRPAAQVGASRSHSAVRSAQLTMHRLCAKPSSIRNLAPPKSNFGGRISETLLQIGYCPKPVTFPEVSVGRPFAKASITLWCSDPWRRTIRMVSNRFAGSPRRDRAVGRRSRGKCSIKAA